MRYRLSQNFKQKIVLQLNNDDEYNSILDRVRKKRPSKIFGRGLIPIQDEIYEFQTAKICLPKDHNYHIKEKIEKLKKTEKDEAPSIGVLPDKVLFSDLEEHVKDLKTLPIGINKNDLKVISYNFKDNYINLILSKDFDNASKFTYFLLEEIKEIKNVNIIIFDVEKTAAKDKKDLKDKFTKFLAYIENNQNEKKHVLGIFVGISKFLEEIADKIMFGEMLRIAQNGNYSFIIAESSAKLKDCSYDPWYKTYVENNKGIWVGNGFEDQYIINYETNRRLIDNNCGPSFGYLVKSNKATMVKLLEMKEKSEDDE